MLEATSSASHRASLLAERLGRSEVFSNLSRGDLLAIAEFSREETYDEGQTLLIEGERADKLFVVERGRVSLEKKVQLGRHSTPRNATIDYIAPGAVAGFSALVHPHAYSTSAICVEPTRVIELDGVALRKYLEEHPAVGFKILATISSMVSSRFRHATGTLTYFLSVVSHELRSPLAAVENYLQLMLEGFAGELGPKQERMVKRCILRVTDLRGQIGDVVDLARMQPEQIEMDFTWFDLSEVGNEAIEDVRLAATEKGIRLNVEPPAEFDPIVGAPRRIRQVLTNLLNNAIRYSPNGSAVTFRASYQPEAVIVEVENEGPGIPPEDIPHIFKDFFRAGNVEGEAGMGLGLSIAKKIVEAHRGRISVTNLTDGGADASGGGRAGTCFTVVLPRDLKTPEMRRQMWKGAEETG
jgi:signal transduction histidine kinase